MSSNRMKRIGQDYLSSLSVIREIQSPSVSEWQASIRRPTLMGEGPLYLGSDHCSRDGPNDGKGSASADRIGQRPAIFGRLISPLHGRSNVSSEQIADLSAGM